jgi:fibronectin type 3 domain-containing protein
MKHIIKVVCLLFVLVGLAQASIRLNWGVSPTPGCKYRIYRATKQIGPYAIIATVNTTSYVDTKPVAGKTYYYFIVSVKNAATSVATKIIQVVG